MRSGTTRRIVIWFSLLIAALLLGFVLSYRATSRIVHGESWLIHTYTVLDQLNEIEASLLQAQLDARGYLESGAPSKLSGYREFTSQIQPQIKQLKQLVSDNPVQGSNVLALERSVSDWRSQWDTSLAQPNPPDRHFVSPDAPFHAARHVQEVESELLNERSNAEAANVRSIKVALGLATLANLFFLVLAAILMVRAEHQRSREREAQSRLAAIVDSSDDAIISKTLDGTITSWNASAQRQYGYKAEEAIGRSINFIIPPERQGEMESILSTIREGHQVDHLETERVRKDGTRLQLEITISPIHDESGKIVGASAIARNITERKQMEESMRQLSARILHAQDEERKRIARELHDTTVQKLALLSMDLTKLKSAHDPEKAATISQHALKLTGECVQELRTLSYILHPPMLDELGLASALKIYAEGFSQRSGIELEIEVQDEWQRLPPEAEITLFRVAQESLSNVMRHSGSRRATIKLIRNGGIQLQVIDEGRGLPSDSATLDQKNLTVGVGILGMRERVKQLGGSLRIASTASGTMVEARLPYARGMDGKNSNSYSG